MDDIVYVINYTYNLLDSTVLTFGNFSFSLFAVLVSFAIISLVAWFVSSLFNSQ